MRVRVRLSKSFPKKLAVATASVEQLKVMAADLPPPELVGED